jgi:2-amino-4-hydroxy-6-hydroxymethyldihydropteridine diphosphokinase
VTICYIGIGANQGDPAAQCIAAVNRLDRLESSVVVRVANFYRTEPVGMKDQPWFVNTVAELSTLLAPDLLLNSCKLIEQEMGRVRESRWGPRIIDLDVLWYGQLVLASGELTLPHPQLLLRRFVLQPLADLIPDVTPPAACHTISELLAESTDANRVELIPGVQWRRPA